MIITIENESFDTKDIKQLYPAVLVKTGYEDEVTQMSLEWLEVESKGRVEIDGYGIFLHLAEKETKSFIYRTREELDQSIAELAEQLQQ